MSQPYPNRVFTHFDSIQKLRNGEIPSPRFVGFHTCYLCNQNCKGCAFAAMKCNSMMSYDDHIKVIDDLCDFGVRAFDFCGGGEPLMMPYFPSIIKYVNSRKAYYGILTNGTCLTETLMEEILQTGTYIRVSLEASDADMYARYKQTEPKVWHDIIDKLKFMIALKVFNGSKCEVSTKFSVSKSLRGMQHYNNILQFKNNIAVDSISIKWLRHEPEELSVHDKVVERALAKLTLGYDALKYPPPPKWCWLNPLHTMIDGYGDVYICCYYYFRLAKHKIGNCLDTPIKELWGSKEHREKLEMIDVGECAHVDCKFFGYHEAINQIDVLGKGYFL